MKMTYLFFALFLTTSMMAQERVDYKQPLEYSNTGEVVFRKILHYPSKSKAALVQLAEEWFARKFDGELIQFDLDSEQRNKLVGRGFYAYPLFNISSDLNELSYVLTISLKEEKIKVEMEELLILGQTSVVAPTGDLIYPKPAHEVISDEKMYKKNGKARIMKRKHKEKILGFWYELINRMDGFFQASQEDDDDW